MKIPFKDIKIGAYFYSNGCGYCLKLDRKVIMLYPTKGLPTYTFKQDELVEPVEELVFKTPFQDHYDSVMGAG